MENHSFYNTPEIVEGYAQETHLQAPEESILSELIAELAQLKVLDIGVGGGRTTLHLAGRCMAYTGVDINQNMILACEQRFRNWPCNLTFSIADARTLETLEDNSFDLVLFSFNGIDYVNHQDRIRAFASIYRVLRPGGYFVFSSHNTNCIPSLLSLRTHLSRNPINTARGLLQWFKLNFIHNKRTTLKQASKSAKIMLNDGAFNFGLQTYYVSVQEQIRQLDGMFSVKNIYSLTTGKPFTSRESAEASTDSWLYYLCTKT
ncbi:methyltransferase domain-containing protein [Saccharophagus degradans]|uniref:class I SAM-dependent methyltransferase n=1 Tax=Saccharophagus degradans TaxID=86304 RepID=UPI001C0A022B|nr:methyltransferase domain-containing protein [Saccharophagus degradans]